MLEICLLIFWILNKSFSKADLQLKEVSKGKQVYYRQSGVQRSLTIQPNFESLTVESNVVIDLGWTHFIATVVIEADKNGSYSVFSEFVCKSFLFLSDLLDLFRFIFPPNDNHW